MNDLVLTKGIMIWNNQILQDYAGHTSLALTVIVRLISKRDFYCNSSTGYRIDGNLWYASLG